MTTDTGNTILCPTEILDWLPWYADDGLSERQRGAVEAHAATCEACRTEITMLRGDAVPDIEAPAWEPAFAKVLARIEAAGPESAVEAGGHRVPAPARRAPRRAGARSLRSRAFSRIAAAAVLAAVAATGWLARDWVAPEAVYVTASEPAPAVAAGHALQIDVVFRTGIEIERINTDLRALGAIMVSGPSEAGRYRLALPAGSNPAAAAAMLRAEGSGVATFAEPVRP
jgi:anti-sigma factor RsiW